MAYFRVSCFFKLLNVISYKPGLDLFVVADSIDEAIKMETFKNHAIFSDPVEIQKFITYIQCDSPNAEVLHKNETSAVLYFEDGETDYYVPIKIELSLCYLEPLHYYYPDDLPEKLQLKRDEDRCFFDGSVDEDWRMNLKIESKWNSRVKALYNQNISYLKKIPPWIWEGISEEDWPDWMKC